MQQAESTPADYSLDDLHRAISEASAEDWQQLAQWIADEGAASGLTESQQRRIVEDIDALAQTGAPFQGDPESLFEALRQHRLGG